MFKHESRRKGREATKNWVQPKAKTKDKTARDNSGMKMKMVEQTESKKKCKMNNNSIVTENKAASMISARIGGEIQTVLQEQG